MNSNAATIIRVIFVHVILNLPHCLAGEVPAKPTSHTQRIIEGWTVHIDDRLLVGDGIELGERGTRILANRLYDLKSVVPSDKVKRLQQVPIWVDRSHGELKSAQYHPSATWLKEHCYDERLVKSVHIPDASYFFVPRHQQEQPWAILHEMAHAYHDLVLNFENPRIQSAWQGFKERGRYQLVLHANGKMRPHYGLTNPMEFFAEMTESYFGMNDFYPFNRAELERDEPEIVQLLDEIWGRKPDDDPGRN